MSAVYREPKMLGAKVTFAVRSNSERDRQSLSKAVSDFDWTPLYLLPSCLSKFDFFQNSMTCLIEQHLPIKLVKRHTTVGYRLFSVDSATKLFGQPISSVRLLPRACGILVDQRYPALVGTHQSARRSGKELVWPGWACQLVL